MAGVMVVGMHRSGTSAVTKTLNVLGVPLCRDDDLLPPYDRSNPSGHWESLTLILLNERLFHALGAHWTCPPVFDAEWQRHPEIVAFKPEALRRFGSVHATPDWAAKDPRLCLTLPFWRETLETEPAVLIVLRDPLDVAGSLRTRDGLSLEHGLALWERYTRAALAGSAGLQARVVTFESLLADPTDWCGEMTRWLGDIGLHPSLQGLDEVTSFLSPERRAGRSTGTLDHPASSPEQRSLNELARGLLGSHRRFTPPELPPETPATGSQLATYVRLVRENHPPRLLDIEGVAAMIGVAPAVVQDSASNGDMPEPVLRVAGNQPVWRLDHLGSWLAGRTPTGRATTGDMGPG